MVAGTGATAASAGLRAEYLPAPAWVQKLSESLQELERAWPGSIGLFVKDLSGGGEFALRADESWYLASGVKLPVALEVLRRIDAEELSFETLIELTENDYVDGAGRTNLKKSGSKLSVRFLIEQMLIYSDNTATDLLIRLVGLENVNQNLRRWVPTGFSRITTLADVRRHVYGAVHPLGFQLAGRQLLKLRRAGRPLARRVAAEGDEPETDPDDRRLQTLASMMKVDRTEFRVASLRDAYEAYYSTRLNSGTLHAYATLLEKVVEDDSLSESSRDFLLRTMVRVKTGKRRIRAGLPRTVAFAHKTGTQYHRSCDLGIAWKSPEDEGTVPRRVIVAACTRGIEELQDAEKAMKAIGEAVSASGVLAL